MLDIKGLTFAHPGQEPLYRDLTLSFDPGLHLVIGANGCGKSSLFRVVAGVERPDAGTVRIGGHDLWSEEVAARQELAYVPEVPDLTPYATVYELVLFVARLRGASVREVDDALERFRLSELRRRTIRQLSLGQRRRVLLTAAWLKTPNHLVLDEPLDGLDQAGREQILRWLGDLVHGDEQRSPATVLVSSHELQPFQALATGVLWRCNGEWRHELVDVAGGFPLAELERRALGDGEAAT